MSNLSALQLFENKTVRVDEEGLICLTDLFKVATEKGLAEGKQNPYEWSRPQRSVKSGSTGKIDDVVSGGRQFIDFVAKNLNTAATHIYKTTRGKHGGTYAHWQIALAYAKYLSHELHMRVNETYMRAQSGDVTLAAEIAEKQQDPKKTAWLAQRVKSIHARNVLTDVLSRHGVKTGVEIAQCTNTVYRHLFHKTAKEMRIARKLPEKANVRESMSRLELAATEFAELLASERIEREQANGLKQCDSHCGHAARIVANAVRDNFS